MTTNAHLNLPSCEFRKTTEVERQYICSHNRVRVEGGVVSAEVCRNCTARALPSIPQHSVASASRAASTRPPRPSNIRRAWNLAASLKDFVADGCRTVTREEFEARLTICEGCEFRSGDSCAKCGCRLSLKARGLAFRCPIGKWPEIPKRKPAAERRKADDRARGRNAQ